MAQIMSMRIVEILKYLIPINVAANSNILHVKSFILDKVEKLSVVMSIRHAAAISPTTTGRTTVKTLCTVALLLNFIKNIAIANISINDGNTNAKVAMLLPKTHIISLPPAFCIAV